MPTLFSDDFADEIKRQFYELRNRAAALELQLRAAHRQTAREDFVLMQASSGNALPAVTASTTGIVPGTVTDAKMLTIDSSGNAVRNTSGRSFEVFNLGGEVAAGKPFWAHREFKTGKWIASGSAAGGGLVAPVAYVKAGSTSATLGTTSSPYVTKWQVGQVYYDSGSTFTCPVTVTTSSNDIKFTRRFSGHVVCYQVYSVQDSSTTVPLYGQIQTAFACSAPGVVKTQIGGSCDIAHRNAFVTPMPTVITAAIIDDSAGYLLKLEVSVATVDSGGPPDACFRSSAVAFFYENVTGSSYMQITT